MPPALSSHASDPAGTFLVLALVLPVTGILLAFLAGGRWFCWLQDLASRRALSRVSGGPEMR